MLCSFTRMFLLFLILFFLHRLFHANHSRPGHVPCESVAQPLARFGKGLRPLAGALQAIDLLSVLEGLDLHFARNHALERGMDGGKRVGLVVLEREAHVLELVANFYRREPGLARRAGTWSFSFAGFRSFCSCNQLSGCCGGGEAYAYGQREPRRTLLDALKDRLI